MFKNKKIIIIILILIIFSAGAGFFILGEGGNKQIDKIAGLFIPTGKGKDEVKTENLDLEEMVLKLADEGVRYLKVSITVSYDSSYKDIEKNTPLIRDNIINCFMAKRADDFTADNLNNIKEEIKNTLNIQLGENVIQNIYFTNIVVQ
ncbi:TPA: flagellar basal body-associated protein FliL [Clostridioides difficile]|uniref:flagellar basal body-associated FliL family protein n=1 Tax=Clostridioides difficile TaxID=1496 RepID=UPI00038CB417|nr:flagellar basal body-associated FliL family protein [Clostridioides difficile]EQG78519.1 flagellar basal body-associated FliL family protein [Clostridioides difficile DA00165]EAA0008456.1 flagellar basal body-associated FliL family protein [Clostridioides difficile]EGT3777162.1 flagellar basal body-associated FliL family protein [Clostridioides difficile]EGT3818066.1 flagellar basal body-associated FliL family protein [Clostridioides difficile]EGT3857179.1 flagellar basal body-associated Fl